MIRRIIYLIIAGIVAFIADQYTKNIILDGYRYYSECIDLILVYNKGVAFSMFAFLDEYLKWLQLLLLAGALFYALYQSQRCYDIPAGILIGAGVSNVYDRFIHGGVVDMLYWHCGFDFAVFNLADVLIDIAVVWILFLSIKPRFCKA